MWHLVKELVPHKHRHPSPGGPGARKGPLHMATLPCTSLHALYCQDCPSPPSGLNSEFSLSLQSWVWFPGAFGALRMGPDIPFHQEEIIFSLFINTIICSAGTMTGFPREHKGCFVKPPSILPYRRLQMWRRLSQRIAGSSPSLPSRAGCWDLESPERKGKKGIGFAMAQKSLSGRKLGQPWCQQRKCYEHPGDV